MTKNRWTNRLSFIITTSAFAVGLGNIWRFPYITGEGGGGAFLLVYLGLMALIGIPLLLIELSLGRMSQARQLTGFGKLSRQSRWNALGWLGIATSIFIKCYYVMIMAWIAIYFWECLSGNIAVLQATELSGHFDDIVSNLGLVIAINVGIMAAAVFVVSRGLQKGLEFFSKWIMLLFVLLMLGLAIWASTLEGAREGLRWYLLPDFSKINLEVILSALGQLFFSVGIAMTVAFVFGSYTDEKENLVLSTTWVVLLDTFIAVLAGFMIFPALFTFGLAPDSGPDLIFITMASVFGQLAYGEVLGALFFLLLFLGGFTSLMAIIQGISDSISEKYKLPTSKALLLVFAIITIGSIPVVFSYSENPIHIFGLTVFGLLDFLTSKIMLPLGGLLIVVFGAYVIGFEKLRAHISKGGGGFVIGGYWRFILKVVIPVTIFLWS